jgi:hypothetical protein
LIAAIADGVSAGGQGRMAAQTNVLSLVEDYFAAPETWDTTVVLDRVISAYNTWLGAHNRRAEASAMTTLTAARAARPNLDARARGRHACLPAARR